MKIQMVVTVEVDADKWRDCNNGPWDGSAREVRRDVRHSIEHCLSQLAIFEEAGARIGVKGELSGE